MHFPDPARSYSGTMAYSRSRAKTWYRPRVRGWPMSYSNRMLGWNPRSRKYQEGMDNEARTASREQVKGAPLLVLVRPAPFDLGQSVKIRCNRPAFFASQAFASRNSGKPFASRPGTSEGP